MRIPLDHVPESITSILLAFTKPYNDLLMQMLEDGRLTQEELDRLRQQIREQGDRLGEILQEDLAKVRGAAHEETPDRD